MFQVILVYRQKPFVADKYIIEGFKRSSLPSEDPLYKRL